MSTFALIHGAGDVGWSWRLVAEALADRGHDAVAPDLPCDDDSATLDDYADAVVEAIGDRRDLVVVGHSYGGFTAPLVAARLRTDLLVFVAAMVPTPGERPADWWAATGYPQAVEAQARHDGGMTGSEDPFVCFYHDVPRPLADEALRRERTESAAASGQPWPLDALPDVPARFVVCTEDRFFPASFLRRVARERLGVEAEEIPAGHCVALSRPRELADLLARGRPR